MNSDAKRSQEPHIVGIGIWEIIGWEVWNIASISKDNVLRVNTG
jgi:hypothetical protein